MEGKTKTVGASRTVQPSMASVEVAQIRTLLKEERRSVINGMNSDLPAYLNYKFSRTASDTQLNQIRAALIVFDQSPITDMICKAALQDPLFGVNTFYKEVNRIIDAILGPAISS